MVQNIGSTQVKHKLPQIIPLIKSTERIESNKNLKLNSGTKNTKCIVMVVDLGFHFLIMPHSTSLVLFKIIVIDYQCNKDVVAYPYIYQDHKDSCLSIYFIL